MEKYQEVFAKYHAKWVRAPLLTAHLYRRATNGKNAAYGICLIDHIFSVLGEPTARKMKHPRREARKWIEWMTEQEQNIPCES